MKRPFRFGFQTFNAKGAKDWAEQAKSFRHLRRIPFYGPNKGKVALLLGLDHAYLHQALREIRGGRFDPIARLTPLGWTCTGRTANQTDQCNSVRFANSFFQSNKKDIQELDTDLQRFWEIEEFPVASSKSELNLSLEDNEIYKKCK